MILRYDNSGVWHIIIEGQEEINKVKTLLSVPCRQSGNIETCVETLFNEIFEKIGSDIYKSTRRIINLESASDYVSDTTYERYHSLLLRSGFNLPFPNKKYLVYEHWDIAIPSLFASLSEEEKMKYWRAVGNYIFSIFGVQAVPQYYISLESNEAVPSDVSISFLDNGEIITDDGTYTIKLTKINNKGRKYIIDSIKKQIESAYNIQVSALKNAYSERIQILEKEIRDIKENSVSTAIAAIKDLSSKGWVFDKNIIMYPHTIVPDKIQYKGIYFDIPNELRTFYIDVLATKIEPKVTAMFALNAFHPNVSNSIGSPNIYNGRIYFNYQVCLGDLNGRPFIEVLHKIDDTLRLINLDSAYGNKATEMAQTLFFYLYKKQIRGEVKAGEVWEVEA